MSGTSRSEREVALERAMHVLWSKGYEATSLSDLCEATGLSRSRFYAIFGSKRTLLMKAVALYVDQRTFHISGVLSGQVSFRDMLAGLLSGLIDGIVEGPGRCGCLLGNTAITLSCSDEGGLAVVREGLARVETLFRNALIAAKARGELGPNADVDALAHFLLASIQGLRLMGKVNPDRRILEDIAATMLCCLDQHAAAELPVRRQWHAPVTGRRRDSRPTA
jgi:TetR/AcrR family transcriptional repressor of nem operon